MQESACNAETTGLVSVSGRSPGEENDNPPQYSCLENSMNRGYSSWDRQESDSTDQPILSAIDKEIG